MHGTDMQIDCAMNAKPDVLHRYAGRYCSGYNCLCVEEKQQLSEKEPETME